MGQDWIFEVLADLRGFAERNDLPALADQLQKAIAVAEVEIAACPGLSQRQQAAAARKPH
jgi:predicted transcriptional regulator